MKLTSKALIWTIILGLFLVLVAILISYKNISRGDLPSKAYSTYTITYGEGYDSKVGYLKVYKPNNPFSRYFIFIHGGGLVTGSIEDKTSRTIINTLLSYGYGVIAIEYKKCDRETQLPEVLSYINKGISIGQDIASKEHRSIGLIGYSAGATVISYFVFNNFCKHINLKNIDRVVLLSGVYKLENLQSRFVESKRQKCGDLYIRLHSNYQPANRKSLAPSLKILAIEGDRDKFDINAGTNKSHLAFIANLAKKSNIPIKAITTTGGHFSSIKWIMENREKFVNFVETSSTRIANNH